MAPVPGMRTTMSSVEILHAECFRVITVKFDYLPKKRQKGEWLQLELDSPRKTSS